MTPAMLAAVPGIAGAAAGDLDPTFDGDGRRVLPVRVRPTDMLVQPDGKVVLPADDSFAVMRLNRDSSLDRGFGGDGIATADFAAGMQKVEGSSPFSRSHESPAFAGLSPFWTRRRGGGDRHRGSPCSPRQGGRARALIRASVPRGADANSTRIGAWRASRRRSSRSTRCREPSPRITGATPHDRWIRLRFSDGVVQEADLAPLLAEAPLLAAIRDDDHVFAAVRVNEESGTIEWPGAIDLDPDVLYGSFEPGVGGRLARRVNQSQP